MTTEIDPTLDILKGDAVKLPFTVVEDDTGDSFDLSGATIGWELRDRRTETEVLSLSDSAVKVTDRNNSNGEFAVKLQTDATNDIDPDVYEEYIRITDGGGNRTSFVGTIQLKDSQ